MPAGPTRSASPTKRLLKAMQVVGPRVDRIKDYLGAGGMAGEQVDA